LIVINPEGRFWSFAATFGLIMAFLLGANAVMRPNEDSPSPPMAARLALGAVGVALAVATVVWVMSG
jgi:hypothetical protein